MVGLLLILLLGSGQPFSWECPDAVQPGETFSLLINCSEAGCAGISAGRVPSSQGLSLLGTSSSTSISTVTTPNGRQLTQVVVLELVYSASMTPGVQTIGPIQLNLHGIGSFTVDEITLLIESSGSPTTYGTGSSPQPVEDVWLAGDLHDPGGRIYPGTRLSIDYYVYSRVGVENVTYYWEAPELGAILNIETIPDSNWESLDTKHDNVTRSLLARVDMAPAAAGSLLAAVFRADITGTDYNRWGKASEWNVESAPILLPVFPFPENPPANWDETLLDSVSVKIQQLPTPPGQGGELSLRVTCIGPGSIYMNESPPLTVRGNAILTEADRGVAENKKWWDYILEPKEIGCCIIGPDSVVWLDRNSYSFHTEVIDPCTLEVSVIPWSDRVIELDTVNSKGSPLCWVTIGVVGVLGMTVLLGTVARKRDKRLASVTSASDLDELLSGLESELSKMLTGKKEYLGYEELDEFLNRCDADSFLSRRILRFWKDLEQSLSDREITGKAFEELKNNADELLDKLRDDLNSNDEKE